MLAWNLVWHSSCPYFQSLSPQPSAALFYSMDNMDKYIPSHFRSIPLNYINILMKIWLPFCNTATFAGSQFWLSALLSFFYCLLMMLSETCHFCRHCCFVLFCFVLFGRLCFCCVLLAYWKLKWKLTPCWMQCHVSLVDIYCCFVHHNRRGEPPICNFLP